MAGSRKSGPLSLNPEVQDLNDGTMIRGLSPRHGPIGTRAASIASLHGKPSATSLITRTPRKKASQVELQVLRQGSRGPEVQKLQRQINARLTGSPKLVVDGMFGPLTHEAVLQYQRGVSIAADGIVGKQTWYQLLKGEKVTVLQASVPKTPPAARGPGAAPTSPTAVQPPKIAPPPAPAAGVWEWPLEDKFAEALRRTAPKLPSNMRHEFEALLSPSSLGIMAGTLVVWAGSHAFGVGEVVDVVLLVGGAFFLGMAVFDVAGELGDFVVVTSTATDERNLDEAASHLARAIGIMGVAAFIALLAKVARGRGGKGGAVEAQPKSPPAKPQSSVKPSEPPPQRLQQATTPKASKTSENLRQGVPKESPKLGTLSDVEARKWYHEQLDQIPGKIPENLPSEQQARLQINLRNQAKRQARDLMADRAKAAELDRSDPIRPAEYYIEKAKAKGYEGDALWDYLKGSSQRSRPSVDKSLGLERKP